ncbi:hypothetical protein B0H19DRAFT_1127819 [Mycena capillaripes]|nr:hypothetical protein B0H19DRAFT_1127819 [Mycena capillaripes]
MSAPAGNSSDYALRSSWMRQWALDLEQLARLRNNLTATQTELEHARSESATLKSALSIVSADAEAYKTRFTIMEKEFSLREATHQQLLENHNALRVELDATNVQLKNQTAAFSKLQQKHEVRK